MVFWSIVLLHSGGTNIYRSVFDYDKFKTAANTLLNFDKIYTYPASKSRALLKIKDVKTGKEVYLSALQVISWMWLICLVV